jgi:beta-lactamase superfamily II metal-dependent hydrolase
MINQNKLPRKLRFRLVKVIYKIILIIAITTGCSNANLKNNDGTVTTIAMNSNEISDSTKGNNEETSLITIDGELKVHYIDVAQGDAILIQCDDKNMLIDAGKNDKGELVDYYLKEQGVEKLEYVIGTHPHEDHIGGLDVVIDNYDIGKIIMPKVTATTETFKDVINSINNKGLKITIPKVGTTYELGEATFEILAPNGSEYSDTNNYSIVIKLTYGNTSFLFTGDCEDVSEEEMVASGLNLKADVLKIGHHGSRDSTTDEFLAAVNPDYAVISVGRSNTYGHPHKTVMDKLKDKNIDVYRTDESGTIVATSDGDKITFNADSDSYDFRDGDNSEVVDDNDDGSYPDDNNSNINFPVETTTSNTGIVIEGIDKIGEIVTIKNTSSVDVNLEGWTLVSVTGNQRYTFEDFVIKAGASITIASGKADGDIKWGAANIWNNSSKDNGVLMDGKGEVVSSFED